MTGTPSAGSDGAGATSAGRRALAGGLVLSVAIHLVLLVLVDLPTPEAPRTDAGAPLREMSLPPSVEVPPPPEPLDRPPPPAVARVEVEEPVLARGSPAPRPPADPVPEPPEVGPVAAGEDDPAISREVPPLLEASESFRDRLRGSYEEAFHGAEVRGRVRVRFFVSPDGEVSRVRIATSSGHRRLDRLARELVEEAEFRPALSLDRTVGVWATQPICFVPEEGQIEETCGSGMALEDR